MGIEAEQKPLESYKKKWVSITLLSIILPVGLLISFRLTGILPEPSQPQIIEVETIGWNISKQKTSVTLNEIVESHYENDDVDGSVNFTIIIGTYHVGDPSYDYDDWLDLAIHCSANTNSTIIYLVKINFSQTDSASSFRISKDPDRVETLNLDMSTHDSEATSTGEGYVVAKATNQTNHVFLGVVADWGFFNKEANHAITVTLETTIFNGTAYVKPVIPILLRVNTS